ncbi:NAD(P)-dependent oxidoreductase [Clostridium manihotivorum]|uniref:NAD(P)-dependent oxidoreductase n=1 Tax=Clostridium manihotivorum TaxID=2320868 RepID=A0A3R5X4M2_9CLOT|nr:NAD(P)-dependent oxidoreductase [Clostridium manihotivorum]QAA34547.1 NAD(P)-dependent oxidoreductase [Clostridium manihotivorum]
MNTLGWIGLGHMGTPMATNLLKEGNKVNVYNRSVEKAVALVELGANTMSSPKETVEQSNIIFIMLSDANAVREVLIQDNGVLQAIKPGKIVVDMSTISPQDSISFAKMVSEKGGAYLDAPVSGSVGAAQSRQLVILVGGDEDAIKTCTPYLNILGKDIIYFGDNGRGTSAKLSINLLLGIMGQGFAETLVFAEKLGVDKEKMIELISKSSMNNGLFQLKKDMYIKEEFLAQFMLELMSKDLGLVKAEADRMKTILPLGEEVNKVYISAKESGKGKLDMAAVYMELKNIW